ncbi:hypothetical protein H7Y63_00325 [Polaromonas sp.]|nr:hypothetical protein [Candidatus Saccharibacteria bacterium]
MAPKKPHIHFESPINYVARAGFATVGAPGNTFSRQGKGVLHNLSVRPATVSGNSGDFQGSFYRSQTLPTHSDILREMGFASGEQPVMPVTWRNQQFNIASRYTARAGRRDPIELSLMISGQEQGVDVTSLRYYEELRQVVAVSCGFVVAKQEFKRDAETKGYELRIIPNFQTPGRLRSEVFTASNIVDLSNKLG